MTKKTLRTVLIVGLAVTNLSLIAFMLLHRPPHREKPREVIIERLDLDQDQITAYDELITEHRKKVKEKEAKMMALKQELYEQLLSDPSQDSMRALAENIGEVQTQLELIHYQHFSDIKALCHEDQMDEFEALVVELSRLFTHPPRRPGK